MIAETIKARKAKIIVLVGSLGTSKTFGAAAILISLAKQYPGSRIGVGRRNTTEMKRGTMLSFHEAASEMNVKDFSENKLEMRWTFENGSTILFFEIDQSHDRDFSKIKSMNLTCAFIDEADAVMQEGFLTTYGRVGRANKNGSPDFIILACNPNERWIKELYYDKWKAGTLPEGVVVIEFDMADSFLPQSYYEKFMDSPNNWKQRYLYNNWSYGDDDNSLFKYAHLDAAHITAVEEGTRYAALDVARFGSDRAVAALWEGKALIDIKILKEKDEKITNPDLGRKFKAYCEAMRVGYDHATVDAVGNGSGVVDWLHENDFECKSFIAGAKADGNYNNLRSESTALLAQDIEKGEVKFLDSCPYLSELKKELTMQQYQVVERQLILESKDKVKARLGMSPDIGDAVIMGYSLIVNRNMLTLDDIAL